MNTIIETGTIDQYYPLKKINNKYKLSWNLQNSGGYLYSWKYCILDNMPSIDKIKQIIESDINNTTTKKIINQFVWNNMRINLSIEHQFDYKLLYDSSIILGGENLPEIVKFSDKGNDIYYEFTSLEDLQDFILCMNDHIRKCIKDGYEKKSSINYLDYKL